MEHEHHKGMGTHHHHVPSPAAPAAGQTFYTCPMHPGVRQQKPGLCPECGMNLILLRPTRRASEAHGADTGHATEPFLKKFWLSLILTVPVVLYSELPQRISGWHAPLFPGSHYLPFVLSSVVFFYAGWIFIMSAWRELRARMPGMMTLIALAITTAYLYSAVITFTGGEHTLFWELTTLITIMLLGHWIEMRAVQGAQGALRELSKLIPDTAEVMREGKTETIPLHDLNTNDVVFVRPGGKIPVDGIVIEGASEADEAMITGESKPVMKKAGDEVIAGTINGDGSLKIKITKIGEHTFLAGVMRLVQEAQASKSKMQLLADRAAFYLTIIAVLTGIATFLFWTLAKAGLSLATERFVAVLVIACPHALGLAIPLVASISTTLAARHGFLVRQRMALEQARKINIVLFDKTGTLTKGEYGVTAVIKNPDAKSNRSENDIIGLAAAVDSHSEHFISKALVKEAERRRIPLSGVRDFVRLAGKGVRGRVGDATVFSGGERIFEETTADKTFVQNPEIKELSQKGETIIYVIAGNEVAGAIALADIIREESKEAIAALKAMGVSVAMLTGDSEEVASWVGNTLGIDEYFARVRPEGKSEKVKLLQQKGNKVAMVGDGINDAPALTQADVGIAIGAGTNIAIESAGIILVRNDPRDIPKIIKLSRLTYAKMIQNLFWATAYNAIALPLAAGVLSSRGVMLQPAVAALFMSLSTVIVAFNALLLRRSKLS